MPDQLSGKALLDRRPRGGTGGAPSPLVGEGGEIEQSEIEPGEGYVSAFANADRYPSPGEHLTMLATLSHKGRGCAADVEADYAAASTGTRAPVMKATASDIV